MVIFVPVASVSKATMRMRTFLGKSKRKNAGEFSLLIGYFKLTMGFKV